MAIDGYWVTGPSLVYVGTGSAGALELLGFTENGADIEVTKHYADVLTDIFGPLTPQDIQDFGEVAQVTAPLIAVDRTVLNKAMNRGDRAANGQLNTPGRMVGANAQSMRLGIAAAADTPWSFSNAIVRPSARFRMATKANPFTITFFAWPYAAYTVTTGKDAVLYTRTLA